MKPETARKQIKGMLRSFSPGSVLMLIGEVFHEMAQEARESGSEVIADDYESAEATTTVVGFGLDAVLPKP